MSNKPLPYKHIQDLSERQLLQVMIDKLCCVASSETYLLDTYTGAAAAYSLRKLSKDTTNVIRVRRSSDNAEADFTADEITDGTMLNWVNEDVVKYNSDFTLGNEDLTEFKGTSTDGETIAGVSDAYKFTLNGGIGSHFPVKTSLHSVGKDYSITFDVYIPSTNVNCDGVVLSLFGVQDIISTNTLDQWVTLTSTYTANYSFLNFYALNGASKSLDADGDVFYLKNIVVTQTTADGLVTTWYDQAGSNDATQATAANQPKIVDAGVLVEENGKPAVDFDGVDDRLNYSGGIDMDANSNISTLSVHKSQSLSSVVFGNDIAANTYFFGTTINSSGETGGFFQSATSGGILDYSGTLISQQLLAYFNFQITSGAYYENGTIQSGTSGLASLDASTDSIGGRAGSNKLNGSIQEIIIFNSDQSSNRTTIETNINNHYNIYP